MHLLLKILLWEVEQLKSKGLLIEFMMVFFVVTACITMLSGFLGMFFFPKEQLGYEAFLTPPLFGFLSALSGLVTKSRKELTIKQMLFREFLQLLLIETMVFGANYIVGVIFEPKVSITLACSIAIIFVLVYVVMWLNDQQSAMLFNEKLKEFQKDVEQTRCVNVRQ